MSASAVILAGGKSRRLGRDKSLVEIGGELLIERVVASMQQLSADIVVVTAADHPLSVLEGRRGMRIVEDLLPGRGALGGIYTGLRTAVEFYSMVVACDMPFLNTALLKHMVGLCEGFDVVIPRFQGYFEPLHAVYSRDCLPAIEGLLDVGDLRILSFLPCVKVRYVDEEEIDLYDPRRLSFINVNTEEDVRKAVEIENGN